MPCYFPMQAGYDVLPDGKKSLVWNLFETAEGSLVFPCGKCLGCKLKKSRDWGLRCVHESKMHEENSFITLTFSPEYLLEMCPGGSLVKSHISDFVRKLRDRIQYRNPDFRARYYGCGEYGDKLGRPHYHLCFFGYGFPDKQYWAKRHGYVYYTSEFLQKLWPYGHCIVGDVNMETASYVARYCVKKITGKSSETHYSGRQPEFALMSRDPGIGRAWFDKYAETDLIHQNNCVINGHEVPVPRFYLDLWKVRYPDSYERGRLERCEFALEHDKDKHPDRLEKMLKCQEARFNKLARIFEVSECY